MSIFDEREGSFSWCNDIEKHLQKKIRMFYHNFLSLFPETNNVALVISVFKYFGELEAPFLYYCIKIS